MKVTGAGKVNWLRLAIVAVAAVLVGLIVLYVSGAQYHGNLWRAVPYRQSDGCPIGERNFGVPLGCIPNSQYNDCANHPCPICLTPATQIETEFGTKAVAQITTRDRVWSQDHSGRRVLVAVKQIGHVQVPPGSSVRHLVLSDGRALYVSPGHPTADGRQIGELKPGDSYEGTKVESNDPVPYNSVTYDILPNSSTGFYWAQGVLLGSTLKL